MHFLTVHSFNDWKYLFDIHKKTGISNNYKYKNLVNIKSYVDHSKIVDGNYEEFKRAKNNSILFCADKHREGSNISFLDACVFLDNVKERSVLTFIQCIGRVLRSTNGKKFGLVIDSYVNEGNMSKNELILRKIIEYYKILNNLSFDKLDWDSKLSNYNKIKSSLCIDMKNKTLGLTCDGINFDVMCGEVLWADLSGDVDTSIEKEMMFTKKDNSNLKKTMVKNYILLVPVSLKSMDNYSFEKQYFKSGGGKWVGSSHKNEKVGNRFGFCNNKTDSIEIFIITDIREYSEKDARKAWDHDTFRNKNIIYLSKKLAEISFSDYKTHEKYSDNLEIYGANIFSWDDSLIKHRNTYKTQKVKVIEKNYYQLS